MRFLKMHSLALLALVCLPWAAQAGGWSVGVRLGFPVYYHPYPYYGYYYYRPYPVYVTPAPVVVQPVPAAEPVYAPPTAIPAPASVSVATPAAAESGAVTIDESFRQLSSADEHARAGAMVQLGRMKVQRAIEPISQALAGDRSPAVREAAARALGLIGSPAALPALQRAAQADEDREVRHSAQFAAEVIRANMPR
jgi:hypothetical protein